MPPVPDQSKQRKLRVAVFNDTRPDNHFGCEIVMTQLLRLLQERSLEPTFIWPVNKVWSDFPDEMPSRGSVDAVIANGEGTIHHTARRQRAAKLCRLSHFAKDTLGVPAILLNATISDVDHDSAENLRYFDRIYVRDRGSADVLRKLGIASTVVPDLTLAAPMPPSSGRHLRLGSDSALPEVSVAMQRWCRRRGFMYVPVRWDRTPGDSRLTRFLKGRLGSLRWRFYAGGAAAWYLRRLCQAHIVITGRYHTATLCIITETPFLAIESNTKKVGWFLEDIFGNTNRLIDICQLDKLDQTVSAPWTTDERQALTAFRASAQERISLMMDDCAALIHSS